MCSVLATKNQFCSVSDSLFFVGIGCMSNDVKVINVSVCIIKLTMLQNIVGI